MAMREIEELAEYRSLMETPEEFQDGFGWKTVIGALFLGFVMMPGSIYLGLVAGQTLGPAAEWTTIILFTEVARRSFTILSKQEVYLLYYITGGLTGIVAGMALAGGPFAGLIWNQYLRRQAPDTLQDQIPIWMAPPPDSPGVVGRTFLDSDWLPAILLLLATNVLSRVAWFSFGYVLFRLTSDGEKLPFPMAPIAAQGATALAEASSKEETWRWRIFSMGTMIGVSYGLIYTFVPILTGVLLVKPVQILPIPWIDFTNGTERLLPAVATGLSTSLDNIFVGFVLPYWMVIGTFLASVTVMIVNPIAQVTGHMPTWKPGMDSISTTFVTSIDLWLSFGIGTAFAVALLGFFKVYASYKEMKASGALAGQKVISLGFGKPPEGRGDFNPHTCLAVFAAATLGYILLCRWLVPEFPWAFVVFYGFVWTPLQSYINARMFGLTGQFIAFPMIREATFILSGRFGYKGIAIWFAPIPLGNYGAQTQKFREVELTGTKFTSILKAEVMVFPIVMVCSFLFWSYIWRLNPIPSINYPYVQKFWDLSAMQTWLWVSSTTEGGQKAFFLQAIKPWLIGGGLVFGMGAYWVLDRLRLPILLIYGYIRGFGMMIHYTVPQAFGAILGRYYFRERFGHENWRRWPPVLAAGFACGMGLISMLAIAMSLVAQSIQEMPF